MGAEIMRAYMMGLTTQEVIRIFDLTVPEFCAIIEDQLASGSSYDCIITKQGYQHA